MIEPEKLAEWKALAEAEEYWDIYHLEKMAAAVPALIAEVERLQDLEFRCCMGCEFGDDNCGDKS